MSDYEFRIMWIDHSRACEDGAVWWDGGRSREAQLEKKGENVSDALRFHRQSQRQSCLPGLCYLLHYSIHVLGGLPMHDEAPEDAGTSLFWYTGQSHPCVRRAAR